MKELLTIPIVAITILSIFSQLGDIANTSGEKAIQFAGDMSSSMDCAIEGRPLSQCSPNLIKNNDFSKEFNHTQEILINISMMNVTNLSEELEL